MRIASYNVNAVNGSLPVPLRWLADTLSGGADREVRNWEKTSDHAPVWIELSDKPGRPTKRTLSK